MRFAMSLAIGFKSAMVAVALLPMALLGGQDRALFYPTILKTGTNLLASAKWRPPSKKSGKDCRTAWVKGTPFDADAPAMEVESFAPESAYWRTFAKVQKGHRYLVGAWVKFSNAKVLFWTYGKKLDGKPSDQRLYSLAGYQSYLSPYFSDELKRQLSGRADEWKLMFRTLEYPDGLVDGNICVAMGLYMATGKVTIAAPFLLDITGVKDVSLMVDVVGAKPMRKLTIEHVGVRDVIWEKSFSSPVADFMEAVPSVTDYMRGMDGKNQIDGHALNIYYADGTSAKVFAPQENVFKQRQ